MVKNGTYDKKKTEKKTAEKKVPIWKLIQQTIESMDGRAKKIEIIDHLLGEHEFKMIELITKRLLKKDKSISQ